MASEPKLQAVGDIGSRLAAPANTASARRPAAAASRSRYPNRLKLGLLAIRIS